MRGKCFEITNGAIKIDTTKRPLHRARVERGRLLSGLDPNRQLLQAEASSINEIALTEYVACALCSPFCLEGGMLGTSTESSKPVLPVRVGRPPVPGSSSLARVGGNRFSNRTVRERSIRGNGADQRDQRRRASGWEASHVSGKSSDRMSGRVLRTSGIAARRLITSRKYANGSTWLAFALAM